jgi:signal transduction histidine kinase
MLSYPAVILIDGEREQRFFDVKFQRYEQGDNEEDVRIFCVAHNVTEQVLAKKQLELNEAELQRRVHERTQELDTINKELQQSNLSLEEFAYAASHDLKAPIRKINMLAQRLNRELAAELNESQQRVFEKMEESASRMLTLIDDLLSFSHISKGAGVFDEIDLNNKLKKVLDDLEMEVLEKGAQISFEKLPVVWGNRRQLQQLFQNLISNALKYTKPGIIPRIHISSRSVTVAELATLPRQLDPTKAYHLVEVKDNGIGFAQEDADQIFNVFTRLHSQAEYSGSGVGLSIVKRVVENHEGHVWAESSVGAGATFKILLPQHVRQLS